MSEVIRSMKEYTYSNSHDGTMVQKPTHKIRLFIQDQIFSKKKFPMRIFPWLKVTELKKEIEKSRIIKNASQFNLRLFYKNIQMANARQNIMDFNLQNDSVIVAQINDQTSISSGIVNPYKIFQKQPQQIIELIMKVIDGLQGGAKPRLTPQGTSGTYILQNSKSIKVAIFKPYDQQPYTPNNPRNYVGKLGSDGIRKGILSGQNATRQVAAYILSAQQQNGVTKNYHGVPVTTYVQFYHPSFSKQCKQVCEASPLICRTQKQISTCKQATKHGSLQQFAQFNDVAGNFSCNLFTVEQVHKIAILDLRILNCDRNQANIGVRKLMKKGSSGNSNVFYQLIPIDHGLSFPDNFQIYDHQLTWMSYSQTKKPFSKQQLEFIENINPLKDVEQLRDKLGFRPVCLRNFRIAEILLKKAAKAGFTLFQIGKMLYRTEQWDSQQQTQNTKKKNDRSQIENLVIQTENLYTTMIQQGIVDAKYNQSSMQKSLQIGDQPKQIPKNQLNLSIQEEKSDQGSHETGSEDEDSSENSQQSETSVLASLPFVYQVNPISQQKQQNSPTATDSQVSVSNQFAISAFQQVQDNGVSMFSDRCIDIVEQSKGQKQNMNVIKQKLSKNDQKPTRSSLANGKRKKKRNVSLPHLKKRTTSYRQTKYQQRRMRQGPNGVIKNHNVNKVSRQEWGELFFHYFEHLLETFLIEKKNSIKKTKSQ